MCVESCGDKEDTTTTEDPEETTEDGGEDTTEKPGPCGDKWTMMSDDETCI